MPSSSRELLETLADWIQTRGPLTPNDAVGWAIRLAKHVESLHEHGVAHGNVSPACVLVGALDPRTPGYMSDVRKTTESLPYHSPERIRNGQLSPADDTWAIAATLYTALTAAPPFVGANDAEIRQQVLRGPPAPISVYGLDDDRLERLMGLTFAQDINKRLTNAALLRRELEKLHPSPAGLTALEDEEVGDEDQAATAMVSLSEDSMRNIFAPASIEADSQSSPDTTPPPEGGDATVMRALPAHIMKMAARAASGSNPPPAPAKEEPQAPLPAALAAPPPPRPSAPRPPTPPAQPPKPPLAPQPPGPGGRLPQQPGAAWEPDTSSDATRVGPSPAAAIAALRQGLPQGGPAPSAPRPPQPSSPGSGPRPGFATPGGGPPPSAPGGSPSSDQDDVRTVMHQGDVGALLRGAGAPGTPGPIAPSSGAFAQAKPPAPNAPAPAFAQAKAPAGFQPPGPAAAPPGFAQPKPGFASPGGAPGFPAPAAPAPAPAAPPPAPEADDEDDGARTVLRESPILTAEMLSRAGISVPKSPASTPGSSPGSTPGLGARPLPAAAPPPQNRWQPAAPPPQPQQPAPQPFQPPPFQQPPAAPMPARGSNAALAQAPAHLQQPMQKETSGSFPSPHEPSHPGFPSPMQPPQPAPAPSAGVSALIQEALAELPPQQQVLSQGGLGSSVESPSQIGLGSSPNLGGQQGFGQFPPGQPGFPNQAPAQGYPLHGGAGAFDPNAAAPAASPESGSAKKGGGYGGLIVTCFVVLIVAAAGTFAVLKYKSKLGLDFLGGPSATAAPAAQTAAPTATATATATAAATATATATSESAPSATATASASSSAKN